MVHHDLDPLRQETLREGAVQALKAVGIRSPGRIVDAALQQSVGAETTAMVGTIGPGIVDVVADGGAVAVVSPTGISEEHRVPWALTSLPWRPIPTRAGVEAAIKNGAPAPLDALRRLLTERVVLPKPTGPWASLLAAWILGTYLLHRFTYWPLLLLEGPPERGKTRAGKAIIFPSFRGSFTPSPTPAVLFRDRAYHRVSLLLDVEDLPGALERSDLGDLILNSFERDGTVRRTTRPDAPPQEQVEEFRTYGATVLVTNKPVKDHAPLRSRCIRVPMPEAGAVVVPDAVIPEEVVELRARIMAWASKVMETPLPEVDVPFTGRMRDLATPILRVLALVDPDAVDHVVELLEDMDKDRRQEASRSWEARVGVALWDARKKVEGGRLYLEDLLPYVNEGFPEGDHLTTQNIGIARRALGLRSGRGGARGTTYIHWPGEEEAKLIHDRYSPEGPEKPSGSSGSSGIVAGEQVSAMNTLNTLGRVFSPERPCPTRDTEHPEHPEHLSREFSEETMDLWETVPDGAEVPHESS
jgi:hypothetical protein